jgi:hypothetical protein
MNLELETIATHTHYLPEDWRGKACEDRTKKVFSAMFQYKAGHFANEILSIVVAPLILCISLPRCAERLCNFVRDSKVEVVGIGDVVGFSTFDFDTFEDENWSIRVRTCGMNRGRLGRRASLSMAVRKQSMAKWRSPFSTSR